ncbi:unnamed protein product [Zymoseptoria tritici ST99CH_3D7]|uniref:Uncharacterized protein n=1 Tax=Zymoseptoria tritici (strain ST99CH_3D7) TaxID=1276538 RepID=A0A1X7RWZ7_ZYMT9|nr:unnamed protein product [Zymoseptoria tritici ST99CH_3D7]
MFASRTAQYGERQRCRLTFPPQTCPIAKSMWEAHCAAQIRTARTSRSIVVDLRSKAFPRKLSYEVIDLDTSSVSPPYTPLYLYGASALATAASSGSHLSPFDSNFSLLYNSSSLVSVAYSAFGPSTIASTGHDSWQKPQ